MYMRKAVYAGKNALKAVLGCISAVSAAVYNKICFSL